MKSRFSLLFLIIFGFFLALFPSVKQEPVKSKPVKIKMDCPDLAAHVIKFRIIERFSAFTGRVRIRGVIKNVGSRTFSGGGGKAYLFENNILRKTKSFSNLSPGEFFSIVYDRKWNTHLQGETGIIPKYIIVISYDSDILKDGNKNNDDCNQKNNYKKRDGTDINKLFK